MSTEDTPVATARDRIPGKSAFIRTRRFSEDLVPEAGAEAVGLERAVDPVGPQLVLEIDGAHAQPFRHLQVHAAAQGDIEEVAIGLVEFEIHTTEAHHGLGVGCGSIAFELTNRYARSDE